MNMRLRNIFSQTLVFPFFFLFFGGGVVALGWFVVGGEYLIPSMPTSRPFAEVGCCWQAFDIFAYCGLVVEIQPLDC